MEIDRIREFGLLSECSESPTFTNMVGKGLAQKVVQTFLGQAAKERTRKRTELFVGR